MSDTEYLRTRWNEDVTGALDREILLAMRRKQPMLPLSPFDAANDLLDYRGLSLKIQLKGLKIVEVDFSYLRCFWAGSLNNCDVKESRFISANFDGRFLGSAFEKCNFSRASLKKSALGSTVFLNCEFSQSSLVGAMARGAKFIKCSFDYANLKKAILLNCIFDDCRFHKTEFNNGSIAGSQFLSSWPSDDQLGNTIT